MSEKSCLLITPG